MDFLGEVVFWVVGAAIAVAIALAILWVIYRFVTRVR